eukprot:scaffold165971_cov51-Attheya_sp.AAC.1
MPAVMVVIVMVVLFFIASCCDRDGGQAEVDNYYRDYSENYVREFKQNIHNPWFMGYRFLVFPLPTKTVALFFSTRVKRRWKPMTTYCQFCFGWVALITNIIAFFAPEHKGNIIVGGGALFINEILLHFWYGYLQYPNLALGRQEDGFFEDIKKCFGTLYNQDEEDHTEKWVNWIGLLFTVVLHVGTIVGICASYITCCILSAVGAGANSDDDNNRRRRPRDDDDDGTHHFALLVGALVGSFAYPILFLIAKRPVFKIMAGCAHHVVEEYYEAKLFKKSGKAFMKKTLFSFVGDMVPIDEMLGQDDVEMPPVVTSRDLDMENVNRPTENKEE